MLFRSMAIESSCDETACAIVKNGREVIANIVASQIKTHEKFGGVIPEIAAREHMDAINIVIEEAFAQSGLKPKDITAFAGTVGPGLVGCLLVGLNAAKTLALVHDKPFIGVNHLNAHLCANYIDTDIKPPFMALLISGGHTQIIDVESYSKQTILGETIDDAVGEAYDKVARLIGLPYPGGPKLDKLAQGKFVVIVKNLSNAEDATKYEVYGWDNGLKCTALDKNTADGDGVIYSFTLASDENAREGSIPKSFFKTSLTVTETALSALLPPAVIPSQPITPITN